MRFAYVAIPYSHDDPAVRAERMRLFWIACARLIERGEHIVSPMTLAPALEAAPDVPYDWQHWQHYSRMMLGVCGKLYVLKLPGWVDSIGVQGEIAEARRRGIEIEYLEPANA